MFTRLLKAAFWSALSLFVGVVGLCVIAVGLNAYVNRNMVYANSETQSAFLRDYSPQPAAAMFQANGAADWMSGGEAHPGEGCSTQRRDFHGDFAIEPQASESLIINVKNDLLAHLSGAGASIFGVNGDPEHGYHFDYILGKSAGCVRISPLTAPATKLAYVPEGAIPTAFDLSIGETYCPKRRPSDRPTSTSF